MKTMPPALMSAFSVILAAAAAVGCSAAADDTDATASAASEAADTCGANLTPGTDVPGADADSLCVVTADLGAKMRGEPAATSENLLASDGWGGLPCGYQLRVDLRDERASILGAKANGCAVWTYGTASVNGEERSGFVNASLLACRRANETNAAFAKRFTPVCTQFAKGTGTPLPQPATCEPTPGWTRSGDGALHRGIPLKEGSGADSALVSTRSPSKVAAMFKAYRQGASGQTEYVGCFKTSASRAYGAGVSAAYTLATTEGFYEYEGGVKRYATWADVEYFVVEGDATID